MNLERTNTTPIVIAIICIAGLGLTAATLSSAQSIGASDGTMMQPLTINDAISSEPDNQNTPRSQTGDTAQSDGQASTLTTCISVLNSTLGFLGVLGGLLVFAGAVYYRYNLPVALLGGWTLAPPVMLAYFLVTNCTSGSSIASRGGGFGVKNPGRSFAPVTDLPPWMMVGFVALLIAAAGAMLFRSARQKDIAVPQEDFEDEEPELDAFAQAAGRAADRIEENNADVDNSVYRAWVEMTSLLDVDSPETYTPGEFADAAIDIGMTESDVSELTTLFNEVRYGDKDVAAREDRAVEILRNIESGYGDEMGVMTSNDDEDTAAGTDIDDDLTGGGDP